MGGCWPAAAWMGRSESGGQRAGKCWPRYAGIEGPVQGVALSGNGRFLASGSFDGTARLWEAASGRLMATLEGHAGPVFCVALSTDGQLLATGGTDGTARLWETKSGRLLVALRGHAGAVRGVALSPDGRRVASASYDRTARLWEASTGESLRTFRADGQYERMDITGLIGITDAQRQNMIMLGAMDRKAIATRSIQ